MGGGVVGGAVGGQYGCQQGVSGRASRPGGWRNAGKIKRRRGEG